MNVDAELEICEAVKRNYDAEKENIEIGSQNWVNEEIIDVVYMVLSQSYSLLLILDSIDISSGP